MLETGRVAVVGFRLNEEKLIGRVLDTMPAFVDRVIVVGRRVHRRAPADVAGGAPDAHGGARCAWCAITAATAAWAPPSSPATRLALRRGAGQRPGGGRWPATRQMDPATCRALLAAPGDRTRPTTRRATGSSRARPGRSSRGTATSANARALAPHQDRFGYWHVRGQPVRLHGDHRRGARGAPARPALPALRVPQPPARGAQQLRLPRAATCPIRPVYNVGEVSGIRLPTRGARRLSWLLVKCYFWRMKEKYIIRDFHPARLLPRPRPDPDGDGLAARALHRLSPPHAGALSPNAVIFDAFLPHHGACRCSSSPCGWTWSTTRGSSRCSAPRR